MKNRFVWVSLVLVLSLLTLGLFTNVASAEEGDGYISVFVIDEDTGDPIEGADIELTLVSESYTAKTDESGLGYFIIPGGESLELEQTGTISASKSGYTSASEDVSIYGSTTFSMGLTESDFNSSTLLFSALLIVLVILILLAFIFRKRWILSILVIVLLVALVLIPVTNVSAELAGSETQMTITDGGRIAFGDMGPRDTLQTLRGQESLIFNAIMKVSVDSFDNINGQWLSQSGFTAEQTYLYASQYKLYTQIFDVEYIDPREDSSGLSMEKFQQDNPQTHQSVYMLNGQTAIADGGSRRDDTDLTRRSSDVRLGPSNVAFDFGLGDIPTGDKSGIAGSLAGAGSVTDSASVMYDLQGQIVEETWVLPAFTAYIFKIKKPISESTIYSGVIYVPKIIQRVQEPGKGGPRIIESHRIHITLPISTRYLNGIVEWEIGEVESGGHISYEKVQRFQPRFKTGWGTWNFPLFNGLRELAKILFPYVRASLEVTRIGEYHVTQPGALSSQTVQETGNTRKRYNLIGI